MNYKIVTITSHEPTEWYYLFRQFVKSLEGEQPMILRPNFWGGLSTKPKVLYQAISEKIIDSEYIIFVDSWDLVFATTGKEMMTRYFSFDSDIVISAEKNCFPDDLKFQFDQIDQPTPYKYLNSGCIVGKTDAIFACLEAMDLPNLPDDHYDEVRGCNYHPNDQYEWMKIFFKQPAKIVLDCYQTLSQTLHDADINEFDFSEKRIKNVLTNSYPCTFHFNGGSKDQMQLREPILKHLNLL